MSTHSDHFYEELFERIVDGKLPRNLSWSSVVDLIGQIGEVQRRGKDELTFVVGPRRELFKRHSSRNLAVDQISQLRKFLNEASVLSEASGTD